MCLFPKLIINKKYTGTKKNQGNVPSLTDERVRYVPVACGNCMECRKAKAREWQVRLHEEIKQHRIAKFITLSFSPEALKELMDKYSLKESNAIAGKAVRLFLERYRKQNKVSLRHWLITELGQNNSERIHLHGIIFGKEFDEEELEKYWKYGNIWIGDYCNQKTINYIIKYVHKIDKKHKNFRPQIFCSAGLGRNYIDFAAQEQHIYRKNKTVEFYALPNGAKVNLPIYYRNKLFTEEQREKLWIEKIEKDTRFINGIEIKRANTDNFEHFRQVLETQQKINKEIGFGDNSSEWKKEDYNITLRMLNKAKRTKKNS